MKNYILSIPIILMIFASSCTAIFEDGKELASDAKTRITEISVDELKAKIENQEEFLLIDVRQKNEFKKGNIPGSFSIPRGVLELKISDEGFWEEEFMYSPLDTDNIVVYCQKGDRGALAAEALLKLGFKNVKNLEGGWVKYNPDFASMKVKEDEGGCGG